jgi:hypothetical protein
MRKFFAHLYIGQLLFFMCSCSAQKNCSNCGIIFAKLKFFDTLKSDFVYDRLSWPGNKIWYSNNYVIEEITEVNHETNSIGHDTAWVKISYYTFMDLDSKSFYNYSSFSDTARLINKFPQPDSFGVSGWSFYIQDDISATEPPQELSDTIIREITYKRYKFINKTKDNGEQIHIAYSRCDKKGTLFQFDKKFSDKVGCPVVRVDLFAIPLNRYSLSKEVEFISHALTDEEMKVFDAWERNAKMNPVNK